MTDREVLEQYASLGGNSETRKLARAIRNLLAENERLSNQLFESDIERRGQKDRGDVFWARIDAALAQAEDVNTPDDYRKIQRTVKALRGEEVVGDE